MESKTKKRLLLGTALTLTVAGLYLILYKSRFLRQPKRNIPQSPYLFVSPAMGKIVAARKFDTADLIEEKYDLSEAEDGFGEEGEEDDDKEEEESHEDQNEDGFFDGEAF